MRSNGRIAALAGAALTAAAAPGLAASSDYLLTLPPGKGELAGTGEQVKVQSFQWGAAGQERTGHSMLGASDRAGVGGADAGAGFAGRGLDIATVDGVPPSASAGTLTLQASLRSCTVGKRYAGAQFAAAGKLYELKDVVIAGCAANGVSLEFSRVTKRKGDVPTR